MSSVSQSAPLEATVKKDVTEVKSSSAAKNATSSNESLASTVKASNSKSDSTQLPSTSSASTIQSALSPSKQSKSIKITSPTSSASSHPVAAAAGASSSRPVSVPGSSHKSGNQPHASGDDLTFIVTDDKSSSSTSASKKLPTLIELRQAEIDQGHMAPFIKKLDARKKADNAASMNEEKTQTSPKSNIKSTSSSSTSSSVPGPTLSAEECLKLQAKVVQHVGASSVIPGHDPREKYVFPPTVATDVGWDAKKTLELELPKKAGSAPRWM